MLGMILADLQAVSINSAPLPMMKINHRLLLSFCAAGFCLAPAEAVQYEIFFDFANVDDTTLSILFSGSPSGQIIQNISDVSVSINGAAYSDSSSYGNNGVVWLGEIKDLDDPKYDPIWTLDDSEYSFAIGWNGYNWGIPPADRIGSAVWIEGDGTNFFAMLFNVPFEEFPIGGNPWGSPANGSTIVTSEVAVPDSGATFSLLAIGALILASLRRKLAASS